MSKMYLTKGATTLLIGLLVASCAHDYDYVAEAEQEAKDNAEATLGFHIPENQDWVMSSAISANFTVPGESGQTYTVKVYSNDPLTEGIGYITTRQTLTGGQNFVAEFRSPSYLTNLVIGLTDILGNTTYKQAPIVNNQVTSLTDYVSNVRTRTQASPEVYGIDAPYDEEWVANYLAMATTKAPTAENIVDDYDNSGISGCQWYANGGGKLWKIINNQTDGIDPADITWYNNNIKDLVEYCEGWKWNEKGYEEYANQILTKLKSWGDNYSSYWSLTVNSDGTYIQDETYVRNFKITDSYSGAITVVASEGLTDGGEATNAERTVVVTGTWNITNDQRVGSLGRIIVANGGTINISSGKTLQLVNQSRLVVLEGGTVEGAGNIMVTNGNAAGAENYNGGTINITGTFNNNFGKFVNDGYFYAQNYASGGSGEGVMTNGFFNHGVAHIKNANADICRNARIYNACQFYVEQDIQVYILEQASGASFIVDGELRGNGGNDGTNDPTYVALSAGSLVQCGTLYNNGTNWTGPTGTEYAVVKAGKITFMNWAQDTWPLEWGYFENNIYMELVDGSNDPGGNGNHVNDNEAEYPYRANWKFTHILANGLDAGTKIRGNGNTKLITSGETEIIKASTGFVKGTSGCTPGYKGDIPTDTTTIVEKMDVWSYAFEDSQKKSDYDMNDVVLKVSENATNSSKLDITLVAAGCEYDNAVYLGNTQIVFTEVHDVLKGAHRQMINTRKNGVLLKPVTATIDKPSGFDFQEADFRIKPSGGDVANELEAGTGDGFVHIQRTPGEAPYGIVIPCDWQWPTERTWITVAYTRFSAWAAETDTAKRDALSNWYKDEGYNVMGESDLPK